MIGNETKFKEWEAKAQMLGIRDDFVIEEEYQMTKTLEGLEVPFRIKYILKEYHGKSKIVYMPPVYKIDPDCFYRNKYIEKVVANKDLYEIGERAFLYCSNLKEVILDCHMREIEPFTFSRCINLTNMEINSRLDIIYAHAFDNCNSLQGINLKSVREIYDKAFAQTGLKHITIPSLAEHFSFGALSYCENLEEINIKSDNCTLELYSDAIFDELINLKVIRMTEKLYNTNYNYIKDKIPSELIEIVR